jgi:hypothetical protein
VKRVRVWEVLGDGPTSVLLLVGAAVIYKVNGAWSDSLMHVPMYGNDCTNSACQEFSSAYVQAQWLNSNVVALISLISIGMAITGICFGWAWYSNRRDALEEDRANHHHAQADESK